MNNFKFCECAQPLDSKWSRCNADVVGRELILSFGIINCEAPIRSLNWTENGKWLLIGETSRFAGVAVSRVQKLPILGVNASNPVTPLNRPTASGRSIQVLPASA